MTWLLILIGLVAIVILYFTIWRWKNRYVGFGIVFDHRKDGSIIVASRLVRSPAGNAGIRIGARVLEYAGIPMESISKESFLQALETFGPEKVGDAVHLTIDNLGVVISVLLEAEMIQGPIPVYDPIAFIPPDDPEAWRYKQGIAFCERTGMFVPTRRLSDEAFRRVFSR